MKSFSGPDSAAKWKLLIGDWFDSELQNEQSADQKKDGWKKNGWDRFSPENSIKWIFYFHFSIESDMISLPVLSS